jgi:hypothetical protein
MRPIYLATEDVLGEQVARAIISQSCENIEVSVRVPGKGSAVLRSKYDGLQKTARSIPVVILTDLDDLPCATALLTRWGPPREPDLLLRIAVREIESWIMADRAAFAEFAHIPVRHIPSCLDEVDDPKRLLLNLVRRHAPRSMQGELLPAVGSRAVMGFGYNALLGAFVQQDWSVMRAALHSPSLARSRERICELDRRS